MIYEREDFYLRNNNDPFWRQVSRDEWIRAERAAGFHPKCASSDPAYMTTQATGGFSGKGVEGMVERTGLFRPKRTGAGIPFLVQGVLVHHAGETMIRVEAPAELRVTHVFVPYDGMVMVWEDFGDVGAPRRLSEAEISQMADAANPR